MHCPDCAYLCLWTTSIWGLHVFLIPDTMALAPSGTFYEGAMTAPGTFPTVATNQAVQANVVAAGYDVQMLQLSASNKIDKPNLLQTFAPKTTQNVTVTFTNTTKEILNDLILSIVTPRGWKADAVGGKGVDSLP